MDFTFTLSVEMTNAILAALNEAPYRVSAPIIATLQAQANEQMKPQLVADTPKEEAKQDGAI